MQYFQEFFNVLPMPCVIVDQEARIVEINAHARKMIGFDACDMPFITIFREPMIFDALESVLSSGVAQSIEHQITRTHGVHQYRIDCQPMRKDDEPRAVLFFHNISEAIHLEQMRKDFIGNISHELRSPLTALSGFIETLQNHGRNDPKARERFLDLMAAETSHMRKLVNDLLALSHVEFHERRKITTQVDLAKLFPLIEERFSVVAQEKSCQLNFQNRIEAKRSGAAAPIYGQWDQLIQLLSNLVENALKYGSQGKSVDVSLSEIEKGIDFENGAYCLCVCDYGNGIDEVHIPRLTERFYRVDMHRARNVGGTGLGLAIVKHIVARHKGRLFIRSSLGEGAQFDVLLPKLPDS